MNTALQVPLGQTGLSVGARVEVHTRYELGRWVRGFTIYEVMTDGYRLRRTSDGSVLAATFGTDEIRVASSVPTRAYRAEPSDGRARRSQLARNDRAQKIGVDR